MDRKHVLIGVGAAVGGVAALLWFLQRAHDQGRRTPFWNDPEQPVEGTAGEPTGSPIAAPSPAASWNAVRPGSPRMQAGSTIRRTYAPTLVDDPESLVR